MPTKQQLDELSKSIKDMQDPSVLIHAFADLDDEDLIGLGSDFNKGNWVLMFDDDDTIDLTENDYEILE